MTGHRPLSDLISALPPERRARVEMRSAELALRDEYFELRDAIRRLETNAEQASRDLTAVLLEDFTARVAALGGELQLVLRLPDGSIETAELVGPK